MVASSNSVSLGSVLVENRNFARFDYGFLGKVKEVMVGRRSFCNKSIGYTFLYIAAFRDSVSVLVKNRNFARCDYGFLGKAKEVMVGRRNFCNKSSGFTCRIFLYAVAFRDSVSVWSKTEILHALVMGFWGKRKK